MFLLEQSSIEYMPNLVKNEWKKEVVLESSAVAGTQVAQPSDYLFLKLLLNTE